MRLIGSLLFAVSSLLAGSLAIAATRPHYGGTLHVAVREAPLSLDPNQPGWVENRNLLNLLFDTLVVLDEQGRPRPSLATSWQAESGHQRWVFVLRHNVTFQDASPLTGEAVAASLRDANPTWKVFANGDSVMIELVAPAPDLPAELALARNGIVRRVGDKFLGTGPFSVSRWESGKILALAAKEDYWDGRPFLDAIEIELSKNLHDQMVSFDLGKAQLIEVPPEQVRRAEIEGRKTEASAPIELIALVFNADPSTPADRKLRDALSLSVDRKSLNAVVAQNGGEPSGSLLPNWMSGYGFLFPSDVNMTSAQQERAEVPQATLWKLGFDANDSIQRLIAERVALSARDAGLRMQIANGGLIDLRLLRVTVPSVDPQVALAELTARLGLPRPTFANGTVEDLYTVENALLRTNRVIPLLYLRDTYAVSTTVRGWRGARDGTWHLEDVWLSGSP